MAIKISVFKNHHLNFEAYGKTLSNKISVVTTTITLKHVYMWGFPKYYLDTGLQ